MSEQVEAKTDVNGDLPEDQGGLTQQDTSKVSKLLVPVPANENERIKILRQTQLLDSDDEATFDRFTSLAQRIFNVT